MNFKKGFSVVEVVVGSTIITLAGVAIVVSLLAYINISSKSSDSYQVAMLFEETAEALQFIRDKSWSENIAILNLNQTYYLSWDGSTYSITETPNSHQDKFTRSFKLETIMRDTNDSFAASGTNDPNTRLVTIRVDWSDKSGQQSRETEMLIHDSYEN